MPVDFGTNAHLGVSDDQVVGGILIRPASVELVFELFLTCDERGDAVFEVAAQQIAVEVGTHRQGEIHRVRFEFEFGECFIAQGS